jgi:hypothetical protein
MKFKYKGRKYNIYMLKELYSKVLLENNKESEQAKDALYKFFEPLFERHITSLKNFNATSLTNSKAFELKLTENPIDFKLPDILGQSNIIRSYFGMEELTAIDQNKNINLQIFNKAIEFDNKNVNIDTGRPLFVIYDEDDKMVFKVYEDDNKNVISHNIQTNTLSTLQDAIIFYNRGEYFDEEGLLVLKRKLQNTIDEQVLDKYFIDEGYRIEQEKLFKKIQTYSISTLPDDIGELTGEFLQKKLYDVLQEKIIKFNITINYNKTPTEEWKGKLFIQSKAWKVISTIPPIKDFIYDSRSVQEKIIAIETAKEYLRKGLVNFLEVQIFLTFVTYDDVELENDITNVLQSSEFDFGSNYEKFLGPTILFSSAAPLSYCRKSMFMEKELLLTGDDFINLISLNNGSGIFSLEDPTLIGISNDRKINFINTYDPRIEAPNGIVIGSTGSGKSFTKTFELVKLLTLGERPFISIIDRGGSFMNFVEIFGGKAVSLNLKDPSNNINPFVYERGFKEAILVLEKQNNGFQNLEIKHEYTDTIGNKILEDKEGKLYTIDVHGNYQPYIDDDFSPQTKLGFFSRIIESMVKNKNPNFKSQIINIIKNILKENTKTFKTKAQLYETSIVVLDSNYEVPERVNYEELEKHLLFNPSELITGKDKDGNPNSENWVFKIDKENNRVVAEHKKIIGKTITFENAQVHIVKYSIDYFKEMLYFTTKDVQDELVKNPEFKTASEIINSYVDFNVYGNLFNGPPLLNFDNELLWTIDMGEETPEDLANIILQSLNIILWSSILSPKNKSRKKMIVFDEVHHILSNVNDTGGAAAIAYMYRTIRKHGGGIHILSQASADILKMDGEVTPEQQPIFSGIKANAMYKYVIGINADDAKRTQEDLQLTDNEISRIVNFSETKTKISSQRGLMYVKTKAFKGFINIEATPTIYAIATTKKEEKNLLEAINKELLANDNVQAFKNKHFLSQSDFKNVVTIIKIKIFATLFPEGIKNVYGENSESIFINKHINNQPEGSDKFLMGFRDFLLQKNKTFLVASIVENELNKLDSIFSR